MRILANDGIEKSAIKAFEEKGMEISADYYDKEAIKEVIKDFDVLIVRSATKVTKEVIDAALGGKLKLIVRAGVGIDNIDAVYAKEKGIEVRNTPNASSDAVAELCLGHMFSVARFIGLANVTMRNGKWDKKAYEGFELGGKTLGIIGMGRIGRSLAKKSKALGMEVVFYNRTKRNEPGMTYMSFEDVLKTADIISIHTPSTGKPVIGKEELEIMKDGSVIINAARGNVIDEAEILEALNSGKLRGIGMDVYVEEPTKNIELINHPNVSCTPHIGASTKEAQERIGKEVVSTVINFLEQK